MIRVKIKFLQDLMNTEKTEPLIQYYQKMNKFYSVSGVGDIDEISSRLVDLIQKF